MPIASLGCVIAAANGAKHPNPEWFNPFPRIKKRKEAKGVILGESARIFDKLSKEGKIPSWVRSAIDVDFVLLAND